MPDVTTTYTSCLRIERTDGFVICLTELDIDLVINDTLLEATWPSVDQTYLSAAGYTPTNMQQTSNNAVNNGDVEGVLTEVGVQREDIIGGRYDFAKLHVFIWDYTTNEVVKKLGSGHWGETTLKDGSYVAEFRSLSQQLQQTIGRTYNPECDAELGSARCQIPIVDYTDTGIVTSVVNNRSFKNIIQDTNLLSQNLTKVDDVYNYGKILFNGVTLDNFNGIITSVTSTTVFEDLTMTEPDNTRDNRAVTFTTGPNIDESRIIVSQIGNVITVESPFTNPFTVGDSYTINGGNLNYDTHMEVKDYILLDDELELFLPMPFQVNVGDTFTIYPGCDKRSVSCKTKFNLINDPVRGNLDNFQGFPDIPGIDQISKFGGQ